MTLCFYKCRWCSRVFELEEEGEPMAAVNGAIYVVPMAPSITTTHRCDPDDEECGRIGVADLLGARREHE